MCLAVWRRPFGPSHDVYTRVSCVLARGVIVGERRLGDDLLHDSMRRFADLERLLRLTDRDRERRRRLTDRKGLRRLEDRERVLRGLVGSLRRADSEYVCSS